MKHKEEPIDRIADFNLRALFVLALLLIAIALILIAAK